MEFSGQPSDYPSHRRRALLLGTVATRAELELTRDGRRFLANDSFLFVDLDEIDEQTDPIISALSRRDLIQPNLLLMQSPTNRHRYERLAQAGKVVAQEKIEATVHVCQALGASEVKILHAERETVESSTHVGAEVRAATGPIPLPMVGIEAGQTNSEIRIDGLRMQTSWSFMGADPDVAQARQALDRSGVYDESLEQMIRLFDSANRPLRHSFEISTESDMRKMNDLVIGLKLPIGGVQAEIESFRRGHSVVRLRLSATFGQASHVREPGPLSTRPTEPT